MSAEIQNILHKVVILGTGRAASAADMTWLEGMQSSGGWQPVIDLVNDYMGNLVARDGMMATVRKGALQGLGLDLADADAEAVSELIASGQMSWADIFVWCIENQAAPGVTLGNRAETAQSLVSGLLNANKQSLQTTLAVENAVRILLESVTNDSETLVNGKIGAEALVEAITAQGGITAVVVDGYVRGATVFVDANGDGVLNPGEWRTRTDNAGKYVLPADTPAGKVIAFGGTDLMTGQAFRGVLTAPVGSTVVTPITTLVQALVESGRPVAEAKSAVLTSLGLPDSIYQLSYDPIVVLSDANASAAAKRDALAVQKIALQVSNVIAQTTAAIRAGDNTVTQTSAANAVASALAGTIGAGSLVDLASQATLTAVVQNAAARAGVSSVANLAGSLAAITAANNAVAANAPTITELTQLAVVAQSSVVTAIASGVASGTLSSAVNSYTGSALNAQVSQAGVGRLTPEVNVPPPPQPDGDDGGGSQTPLSFTLTYSQSILLSGGNGSSGQSGTDGVFPGEDGGFGSAGGPGVQSSVPVVLTGAAGGQIANVVLAGYGGGVTLSSTGGVGGDGGAGGSGRNGASGGAGGNAGPGGAGGAGADGQYAINVIENVNKLVLTSAGVGPNIIRGGAGGTGGAGGDGGNGGAGDGGGAGGFGGAGGIGGNGGNGAVAINNGTGLLSVEILGSRDLTIAGGAGGAGGLGGLGGVRGSGGVGEDGVAGPDGNAGESEIHGFSNAVNLNASTFTGRLTVSGSPSNDVMTGGSGDDTITGGAGADTLDGGAGTDTVSYADVTAATSHGLGNIAGMAINLSGATVTAGAIATAMGGTVVIGGGAGVAGADLAAGSAGYLATSAANSTTTMVRDTLTGFEAVIGSVLADYIILGNGGMTANGGLGNDVIIGGDGNDTITGGDGNDTIRGRAGNDTIRGGRGNDEIYGNEGDDLIFGDDGNDYIHGGQGNDTIWGGDGNDVILGGTTGDDVLYGENGDDILEGGAGADTLTGGAGADTFVYAAVTDSAASVAANDTVSFDSITDFTTASDKINISAINAALTGGAVGTSITVTAMTVATADTFAGVVTGVGAITASAAGGALQAYVVTVSAGVVAGMYLLVNDNDTAMDVGDLFIKLTGTSVAPVAGDFILAGG